MITSSTPKQTRRLESGDVINDSPLSRNEGIVSGPYENILCSNDGQAWTNVTISEK
jgi:hypothetical protein